MIPITLTIGRYVKKCGYPLYLYTFTVYAGSSLYTSSEQGIMDDFHVDQIEATLGLALYVLGYGMGCLLLSPLTEIPSVGRNPPYAISGLLFLLLCIPGSLVQNYAGLMVLRFLLGLMASPPLATSGASLGDIWRPSSFPFAVGIWAATTAMGPALGPTLSSFAVRALGWRFASWELMILVGPTYILLIATVPETSGLTILYYRAKRLVEQRGDPAIKSEAQMKKEHLTVNGLLWDALVKPWELNIKDPALLFTTVYFGLIYGIYYTFFESFPIVFSVDYDFKPEITALIYLGAIPAGFLAVALHSIYIKRVLPRLKDGSFGDLENHLVLGMIFSWLIPGGLFLYAWSARPSVHWIAPTLGFAILMFAMYFVTQSIFSYIPMIYPRYAASILAASSFARSAFAFAAILFAGPMFDALGVDGGFGKKLRERSQFAID
ncbi:benomyl/methotrexate resistance protein [Penicillium lagena]|uniref:benomyl/methotrexate resistance protein n=1 Tax=Penicillium lagena TaxID=94218 RepID=UPI002541F167|nr:benomyl/methotrexate resistance protein [Penicillium lagena]KAJ5612042.1 benomyl/methotrexate resistance protein [Penicillium lagena]